uniref:Uncharacterized protein n=1 Tax=Setaria italica TaxID=4555 RepID=K3Y2J2_SETIT
MQSPRITADEEILRTILNRKESLQRNHLDIKDKLSAILHLLRQDTSVLLEDAEPIQKLFRQIRTHLTDELIELLTPAAFIELHYSQVQEAKKCIASRQANHQAAIQLDTTRLKTLETERDQLILELDLVNKAIAVAQDKMNSYTSAIQENKKELMAFVNQARNQHQQINKVSGSDEEDFQLIVNIDNIRLRAIHAIEKAL